MEPVVGEVVGEEEEHPDPPIAVVEAKRGQLVEGDEDREDDELPGDVDDDVAEPHGEARLRVAFLKADVLAIVVAKVLERHVLGDQEEDEDRDRVVENLRHGSEKVPPEGEAECHSGPP